ncbi:protein swallow [Stomoxys calcitrans]|uniref:Protein swallow n=2 Tax=Stomoxys calcitrans TaxID=35570 RepID=A0A1I8QCQ0_STOCA|nr:protein swallow [Stomoxys calcitrans]
MSIQDESFPYDDLEMSHNSGQKHMVGGVGDGNIECDQKNVNTEDAYNDVSTSSSSRHPNDSTHSSNEDAPESETSGKTNASEPQENDMKKHEHTRNNQSKSVSYQDIHSEYTKRRYKHVESKVGQYIANMKAQDEKRRNSHKFQRHRSMPETLSGPRSIESVPELRNSSKRRGILRHSTNDLDDMRDQESVISDHDTENFDNITATTSSSSRELGQQDAGIYLDKLTYDQLLSDKERCEYLETKMEEKKAENWRLKQNLDTMRIEYTLCKDKLKQINQNQRLSGQFGIMGNALGRSSLQSLFHQQETAEKGTQTENMLTPSPVPPLLNRPEMFDTPLTLDSNNNSMDNAAVGALAPAPIKVAKTIATIQPLSLNFSTIMEQDNSRGECSINNTMCFLRQRSNSMANRQKSTPLALAINNASTVSSNKNNSLIRNSDSAIDIEVIESPRKQRQSRREEFIYYEKHPQQRFSTFQKSRRNPVANNSQSEAETSYSAIELTNSQPSCDDSGVGVPRKSHKRHSLRARMMRFFGACTKCEDTNVSLDTVDNSQQSSMSQIPLLEKSRPNLR